jgi:DNA-binding beta-propeller fold protein YncE
MRNPLAGAAPGNQPALAELRKGKIVMPLPQIPRSITGRQVCAALGVLLLSLAGCATPEQEVTQAPDLEELVWPLPPEQPRIKFVRSFSFRKDVEEEIGIDLADVLLGKRKGSGESLKKPYGVHADKDGRIFVADTGWGKVMVFDFQNKKFSVWGESGQGFLSKPTGIASDSQGRVYVTDSIQKRVVVYDRDGKFLSAMGKKGELERPVGIAVNEGLGRVYVVDTKKHHIAVFDMDGALVSTIGERGAGPGQFNLPTNLTVGGDGRLYVMDTMNFRVQILDPEGKALKSFGTNGDQPGQFARPKGIAVDSDGHIYVVDAAFNNFQIFTSEGELLLFVGAGGQGLGQFWLPAGAYIDGQDRIYVADQYNFRVQVFQYLREDGAGEAGDGSEPEEAVAPKEQEG